MNQLFSNYDNNLFKTNFIENTSPLFIAVNFLACALIFSPLLSCFFGPCWTSHLQNRPSNTTLSAPSPKTLAHPVAPNTQPNKHTPQVNQFTHTYHSTPNTHPPHPAPPANHFKGRCYQSEDRPTEAYPRRDPNCSNLTSQTELLNNKTNPHLAHVKNTFCYLKVCSTVDRDLETNFQYLRCNRSICPFGSNAIKMSPRYWEMS